MLKDTAQSSGGLMLRYLRAGQGEKLGVRTAPITARCKTNAECYFCFLPFFIKAKIFFGFLSVRENKNQCRFFIKVKWPTVNFQKVGIPVKSNMTPIQQWRWGPGLGASTLWPGKICVSYHAPHRLECFIACQTGNSLPLCMIVSPKISCH